MFQSFISTFNELKDKDFQINNKKLNTVIKKYCFYLNEEVFQNEDLINNNFQESKVIIIKYHKDTELSYFILGFQRTIIVIEQNSINSLKDLFNSNENYSICFLADTKNYFDKKIEINYNEITYNRKFELEICNFNNELHLKKSKFHNEWKIIEPCISGYLIKESYRKLKKDRIFDFFLHQSDNLEPMIIKEDDIIDLTTIFSGLVFGVFLVYHIEKEEIFVVKRQNSLDSEFEKLIKRELNNYSKLNYPFLPKFYGSNEINTFLVIEYVDGKTLQDIDQIKLSWNEKITIIFELLLVFEFFHRNKFIYRDLKPNNVMIDENKTIILIDFDRMIGFTDNNRSIGFNTIFADPKINEKNVISECDIYSIGQMIFYIINEENPTSNSSFNCENDECYILERIYRKCIDDNPQNRPSILDIIIEFFINFHFRIEISQYLWEFNDFFCIYYKNQKIPIIQIHQNFIYQNGKYIKRDIDKPIEYYYDPDMLFHHAICYYIGKYVEKDVNKAIYFLSIASEKNHSEAQALLGSIYYVNIDVFDIKKSIHYLSLASNLNNVNAQLSLGLIYYEGEYIEQDIEKSVYYLTLASNQNCSEAQFTLGLIYYEGNNIEKNIEKSIHYFLLAANQNHSKAFYYLGIIYLHEKYDINKSIHYFSLASNQNNAEAQYKLGLIYFEGILIQRDINKSIHYFSLASNQKHPLAQFNLGLIYYEGKYIQRDINKSIYYFSNSNNPIGHFYLANIYHYGEFINRDIKKAIYYYSLLSQINFPESNYNLGIIYYEGKYIERDIDKAIHYLLLESKSNHSESLFALGFIYFEGKYVIQNINMAINYFTLASDLNHAEAQFMLGSIYYNNIYAKRDINKAIHFLSLASKKNHQNAQILLGVIHSDDKYIKCDIFKAIHYFTLASNQNNSDAQYILGQIYYLSGYVPVDIDKAIHYFTLASNQNNYKAQFSLGCIYCDKKNDKLDINKAIYYFTLASNQNHSEAQFCLGSIFYKGEYISKDINKSIYYFLLAAKNNHPSAQYILGLLFYEGEYIKRDLNKALYFLNHASNQNYPEAQFHLGLIYYEGKIVEQNINKGISYLIKSTKKKSTIKSEALFRVGVLYHDGQNIEKSIKKAIYYYKEASNFNNQFAKNNLGIIYKNIIKNLNLSIEYFTEAIKQKNDPLSMYNLAHIYIYDDSIQNNIDLSIKLLIRSYNLCNYGLILNMLCLALIKKIGFDISFEIIQKELIAFKENSTDLSINILQMIQKENLNNKSIFEKFFNAFKKIDFLYDFYYCLVPSINFEITKVTKRQDITSKFYEGFGLELF